MKATKLLFAPSFLLSEGSLAREATTPNSALLSSHTVELGPYKSAYEKAKALVGSLNKTEKITIITGGSIPGVWTALEDHDEVSGVGSNYYVSGFVGANALAMTWDRDLAYSQFLATGKEFYGMGYNLVYGPISMEHAISGQNAAGAIATGRHFLLNEQETN
ncbi:Glycoside hydrolase superfamily [Penicillium longicatenatum]|uniref:Glycoside hydrolase superfamily n=1 Tax=Penicillium longicatenatum TaxID=1561947 RepID=UPI0025495647|nr:Glycoside hydrolase superfamily [Penicillium longicatenatum]KAJ5651334.1 Glycoside hydrolase superfamily [Penicillium longicatenatum]